jgi:fatty acid desaturase
MQPAIPVERNDAIEWPTIGLLVVIHASFLALTWFHASIPLWILLPLAAWTSAWFSSAQHEIIHGHPTRNRALNTALGFAPIWLWLPFERYRQSHLTHHRDERLTDPIDDPESRYWTEEAWEKLGPTGRFLVRMQSRIPGRMAIGPAWAMGVFLKREIGRLAHGDGEAWRIWSVHLAGVAVLLWWVLVVCGMPFWVYLLGFVYGGTALALIRSFAEHRAESEVERRTAIVEKSPLFGLLFLNNNLHVVHHDLPTVPWYRLPRIYREHREHFHAKNGGLVYDGYLEIFRRFTWKPHHQQIHPFGRAPAKDGSQPGSG